MKTLDYTDESRKDETCLQFKMKKHFIKTRKISQKFKNVLDVELLYYKSNVLYVVGIYEIHSSICIEIKGPVPTKNMQTPLSVLIPLSWKMRNEKSIFWFLFFELSWKLIENWWFLEQKWP